MAQKKKKKDNTALQKVAQAQLRKEHLRRLRNFFVLLNDLPFYAMLSERTIEALYRFRASPIKILVKQGSTVPKEVVDVIWRQIKSYMADVMMPLFEGGPSVSISDYYYIGVTLDLFFMEDALILKERSPKLDISKAGPDTLKYMATGDERNLYYQEEVDDTLEYLAVIFSDLSDKMYLVSRKSDMYEDKTDFRRHSRIEIETYMPERRQFTVDGQTRPAIRLCWKGGYYDIKVQFTAEQLGLPEYPADTLFDVYVQHHALKRLAERIDSISPGIMHFDMLMSFLKCEAIRERNGGFFIAFEVLGLKAGYFRATIVDGCLLVRTFLFLLNNGTPEGRKLEKLTGLQMLDKKYLDIDRLSMFINSDIYENEELSELFRQAGCESLLQLCPKLKNSDLWKHPEKEIEMSTRLLEYMRKGREEISEMIVTDPET